MWLSVVLGLIVVLALAISLPLALGRSDSTETTPESNSTYQHEVPILTNLNLLRNDQHVHMDPIYYIMANMFLWTQSTYVMINMFF